MRLNAFLLSTAIFLVPPVNAQQSAPAPTAPTTAKAATTDPAEFSNLAAVSNMFEIESSTLANDKSQNADVKAFAEQMIADHTKAGQEMTAAAGSENLTPPTQLDATHQAQLDELKAAEGEAFDAAYISAQVKAHDDAVALFEGYSTAGPDGALKDFAVKTLPTLKMHQERVHSLAGR
jgi:putative membrane protein